MANISLYNANGEVISELTLSDSVFNSEVHEQAIYDCVILSRAAQRQGTASTKTRAEVSGGGKKPYRQKGTGRARQGSIRSIQWRGGGVAFGPKPRKYTFKLNQKVRQLGLRSALSYHYQNQTLVVVENLGIQESKTKLFINLLENLHVDSKALVLNAGVSTEEYRSSHNLPTVLLEEASHASVYDILNCKKLVLTKSAVEHFEGVLNHE
ncbi:MAG: 50S ribosomal protein L4 [Acholeplasmatales bacterium]|jgi:large subunit ribosomal protein L4|nr:50S ribosomal protein L4 [Acholeplasmatales bacterium]